VGGGYSGGAGRWRGSRSGSEQVGQPERTAVPPNHVRVDLLVDLVGAISLLQKRWQVFGDVVMVEAPCLGASARPVVLDCVPGEIVEEALDGALGHQIGRE